ncbi:DHA2 family efflux MFS transporter permease subunit [Nocardioides marmorisolisilvae]|uniref:DHA2 family efflux MFS transporter permease subunit n=1 Tax=Nocardioides marmorisolisilvae TaxID=1542737 RepID=A0A3N0DWF3_9ACTN|nr:DHA2 family efflux MFS transporter permease subunit [Nocardioides marmorisolisilvae]RNL79938.1 DHA2 family efflux MFS transporter permease subunit [Nocardioides marmorisolisilvae]
MTDTTIADPTGSTEDVAETGTHKHLGWALVLICVAQLMVVLDSTIANIAIPFIGKDLDISRANLQWVVTGYALAFGGLLLLGGRLGDLYGRRRIFMTGLTLFAVASGLGGFAQNEAMLLSSRALQGLGAALAAPAALALITTTFPAGPRRNQAFSVYAAMSGVGAAIGLLLGGWLTGLHPAGIEGWRLTFLINVPIGLIAAFAAPRLLAESESRRGQLDLPGAVSGTLGLISLIYGINRAGQHGWGNTWTVIFLVVGVALLALFVAIERNVKNPLLPLRILANRTRATAFVAMMIVPAAMFAMFFFLSQFVQDVMGYTPLQAGLSFLPFPFAMVFGATLSSKLMNKIDPRFLAGTGTLLAGIALLNFHRLSVDASAGNIVARASGHGGAFLGDTISYWSSIFPFIALMAFGMSLTFIPLTLAAVHHVDEKDSGIGSGVLNTMQQVGGALGLATLSTIATHYITEKATSLGGAVGAAIHGSGAHADPAAVKSLVGQAAFTSGGTHAFLVGAFMIWTASVVLWTFLSVSHEEMATDAAPVAGH